MIYCVWTVNLQRMLLQLDDEGSTRHHLERLYYDPLMSSRGGAVGMLGIQLGTNFRLYSDHLAHTAVLPMGTLVASVWCFIKAFSSAGIRKNQN